MEQVFIVPFHVQRMAQSIMPPSVSGAYVSCYTSGSDYTEAVKKCLASLMADGMHPKEVLQPINVMDMKDWSKHIVEQWPDQFSSLPDQLNFESSIQDGRVVYGPFGSYA